MAIEYIKILHRHFTIQPESRDVILVIPWLFIQYGKIPTDSSLSHETIG